MLREIRARGFVISSKRRGWQFSYRISAFLTRQLYNLSRVVSIYWLLTLNVWFRTSFPCTFVGESLTYTGIDSIKSNTKKENPEYMIRKSIYGKTTWFLFEMLSTLHTCVCWVLHWLHSPRWPLEVPLTLAPELFVGLFNGIQIKMFNGWPQLVQQRTMDLRRDFV